MKKLLILSITVILALSITACGANQTDTDPSTGPDPTNTIQPNDDQELDEDTENQESGDTQDPDKDTEDPPSNDTKDPDEGTVDPPSNDTKDPDEGTVDPPSNDTKDPDEGTVDPPSNDTKDPDEGTVDPDNGSVLDGSLEGILEKIYETADCSENFKEYAKTGLLKTKVTEERSAYYLGKEGIEFEEALASEPMMMPSAYELTLVRVKEGADINKIKQEIRENVNPRKWICVGVDPENVIVDSIDDIIIIIMSNNECEALHDAFLALQK